MSLRIRSGKNLATGLTFMGIGTAFLLIGSEYEMGEATRMGPGYFPAILATILFLIGVVLAAASLVIDGPEPSRVVLRPLVLVVAAMVMFGVVLETLGVLLATAMLIAVSSFASWHFRVGQIVINSLFLTAFAYVVFVYALEVPFKVWPWAP